MNKDVIRTLYGCEMTDRFFCPAGHYLYFRRCSSFFRNGSIMIIMTIKGVDRIELLFCHQTTLV